MDATLQNLVQGVLTVARATLAKRKYAHLLMRMHCLRLICIPSAALPEEGEPPSPRLCGCEDIRVTCATTPLEIVYLQPTATSEKADGDGVHVLTFDELAEFLTRYDDPVAKRFRESLRSWAQSSTIR